LWKHKFSFIILLITTLGLVLCIKLLKAPAEEFCTGVGYLPSNLPTKSVYPIKVVVEPFQGRHQVYAIFQLDGSKLPPNERVIVTVGGAGHYCEVSNSVGKYFEGIEPPPGFYLSRHFIRTRTALRLSAKGLLGKLRSPENWMLTYTSDRKG
jgi:hypothetical protein